METYQKSLKNNYYVLDIANYARMEGEQIGIVKGEQKKSKHFALKLLKKGMSVEEVADLTELPKEQVLELLHQLPIS